MRTRYQRSTDRAALALAQAGGAGWGRLPVGGADERGDHFGLRTGIGALHADDRHRRGTAGLDREAGVGRDEDARLRLHGSGRAVDVHDALTGEDVQDFLRGAVAQPR